MFHMKHGTPWQRPAFLPGTLFAGEELI